MKFFIFLLLVAVFLNSLFLAVISEPLLYLVSLAAFLLILVYTFFVFVRKQKMPETAGWQLGNAIDLSTPEKKKIENAVISRQAINLGSGIFNVLYVSRKH